MKNGSVGMTSKWFNALLCLNNNLEEIWLLT